jgi:very-short-patch-repair endonuclease
MSGTIFYFTKKQNEVESLVSEMGFRVRAEVDIEQYRADLFIEELQLIIEVDGPSHKRLKKEGELVTVDSPKISQRDKILLDFCPNGVWHIPVDMDNDLLKEEFQKIVNAIGEAEKG